MSTAAATDRTWVDREPAERRATIEERDSAFRLRHVPDWFRLTILASKDRLGLRFQPYILKGYDVVQVFAEKHGRPNAVGFGFDHFGSCGKLFVNQPYLGLDDARQLGEDVARILGVKLEAVDDMAQWFPGAVWIAWSQNPSNPLPATDSQKRRIGWLRQAAGLEPLPREMLATLDRERAAELIGAMKPRRTARQSGGLYE